MPRLCNKCREEPGSRRCTGCLNQWYCSKECQVQDWAYHKFDCNPKNGLTTADRLWRACGRDVIPDHEQTLIDYGFQRAFSGDNKSHLMGVYRYVTMLSNTPASAKMLHHWRKRGVLLEEIIKSYDSIPLKFRGGHYTWLMENQWVLDGKKPGEEEKAMAKAMALRIARKGWIYSGGSDATTDSQIQQVVNQWTKDKTRCWFLCGSLLERQFPGPDSELCIPFGFCTCRLGTGSEQSLCRIYQELIDLCTFDEFLLAYETSQLYALFTSKGLGRRLGLLHPLVEGVMKTSPWMNYSVWDLKQFVVQEPGGEEPNGTLEPPINPVNVDYGFMNCKTANEFNDLKAVYRTLFETTECSPPDLHLACIEGRLFEYTSKLVKLEGKKKYKRLMANLYPLPNFETDPSPP